MILDDQRLDDGIRRGCVEVVMNGICRSSWIVEIVDGIAGDVVSLGENLCLVTFPETFREMLGRVVL